MWRLSGLGDFRDRGGFARTGATSKGREAMNDLPTPTESRKPAWSKPRIARMGTIRDIAQRNTPNNQAANAKKS